MSSADLMPEERNRIYQEEMIRQQAASDAIPKPSAIKFVFSVGWFMLKIWLVLVGIGAFAVLLIPLIVRLKS